MITKRQKEILKELKNGGQILENKFGGTSYHLLDKDGKIDYFNKILYKTYYSLLSNFLIKRVLVEGFRTYYGITDEGLKHVENEQ